MASFEVYISEKGMGKMGTTQQHPSNLNFTKLFDGIDRNVESGYNSFILSIVMISFVLLFLNLYQSLGKFSRCEICDTFSCFSLKTGFFISCKPSPLETICMTCQNPISWEK